jgi:hypothetical protein
MRATALTKRGVGTRLISLQVPYLSPINSYIRYKYMYRTPSFSANKFIFPYSDVTFMLHEPKSRLWLRYKVLSDKAIMARVLFFPSNFPTCYPCFSSKIMNCTPCTNTFITILHTHRSF